MHLLQKTISWWLCIYGRGTISHVCCAESLSHIQLFVTSWTVARQAPLSMEILQARILEWTVMPSSRESSQCRDRTQVSHTAGGFFTVWATREALHISFTEWISYSWLRILQRGTGGLSLALVLPWDLDPFCGRFPNPSQSTLALLWEWAGLLIILWTGVVPNGALGSPGMKFMPVMGSKILGPSVVPASWCTPHHFSLFPVSVQAGILV